MVVFGCLLRAPSKIQSRDRLGICRFFFVLSRAATFQVSALFELGFVHSPEGSERILAPTETLVQREVCPYSALRVRLRLAQGNSNYSVYATDT